MMVIESQTSNPHADFNFVNPFINTNAMAAPEDRTSSLTWEVHHVIRHGRVCKKSGPSLDLVVGGHFRPVGAPLDPGDPGILATS